MILFDNRTNTHIDNKILEFLESIAMDLTKKNIELLLVENAEMMALNKRFLNKDYATDVLSFPLDFSDIDFSDIKRDFHNAKSSKECDFACNSSDDSTYDSACDSANIEDSSLMLGSIVISLDIAMQMAEKYHHSLQSELAILFTHGLLHLLGFNHECDNGEHRAKEQEILGKFHIKPLIERNA